MMPGMMPGWGFGGMPNVPQKFEEQYHCYSVAFADKAQHEKGDKILLPPSALDTLARLQVDYPMLFRISHAGTETHVGVLEFSAEEGTCYIPHWIMENLHIEEGALVTVLNVSLPKATFVKLQPQSVDFLEISNPRAVLEHALRNFSCVTIGDMIKIPYNDKAYRLLLQDVKPAHAACIIETDCNVDFDAPVGYQEPTRAFAEKHIEDLTQAAQTANKEEEEAPKGVQIIDGKIIRPEDDDVKPPPLPEQLAAQPGQTGVQRNSAIMESAPEVDYWAVSAGDGSRLDGKAPSQLKDAQGNALDVRTLRAEATAKRAAALEQANATAALAGRSLDGKTVIEPAAAPAAPKRKSRVGNKFSKLKSASASFQGSANSFK